VVEPQCAAERHEHLVGRLVVTAAFEPQVVLGADAREPCDLFAAQAVHSSSGLAGEADVLGLDECPTGAEVLPQFGPSRIHASRIAGIRKERENYRSPGVPLRAMVWCGCSPNRSR
jgi:hypothetical protein